MAQTAAVLQTSLQGVESKVQTLAQESAAALESARMASERALQVVQSEVGSLQTGQSHQADQVAALHTEVQRVRQDATQMSVAADLQARTGQATQAADMDQKLRQQDQRLMDVVKQLQAELQRRTVKENEREAELARLRDDVAKEQQARQSMQEYIQNFEAALTPVNMMAMDVDPTEEFKVRVSDIEGAKPVIQTVDRMQAVPAPIMTYHAQFSAAQQAEPAVGFAKGPDGMYDAQLQYSVPVSMPASIQFPPGQIL